MKVALGSLLVKKMGQKAAIPEGYNQETAGNDVNLDEDNNSQNDIEEDSNDGLEYGEKLEEAPIEERRRRCNLRR